MFYAKEHAPETADPKRIAYAIHALLPFWSDRHVALVKGETCRAYLRYREGLGVGAGTIRRELGCLQAALRHCQREGHIPEIPMAWLPPRPPPKERWLTRSEAAALLRAARAEPKARAHLSLFILIALYSGARRTSILELRWTQNTEGGWVNLERGVIDFNPLRRAQTKKKRPVVQVPPRLLRFLRYARERSSTDWVIAVDGQPVRSVKRSFATAARKAGLDDIHIHDLRRTAASWMAQGSVPTGKAAKYLGMSEETFERVYAKHDPHRFDEVLEVFK